MGFACEAVHGGVATMKHALALLVIALLLGSHFAGAQSTLALQEKCSAAAEKYFLEVTKGATETDKDGTLWAYNYQCHYSKKLDRCFILFITSSFPKDKDKPVLWFEDVYDVFEAKPYGSFLRAQYKNYNWPVRECTVGDKVCHSEDEFKTLIKPYMEE
jgi:hypothetical protein